jgi:hypothetical protein
MRTSRFLHALATVLSISHEISHASLFASPNVRKCATISLASAGYGVSYQGLIANSDYGFSMTIPKGLMGWGAAPNAPFHGFTVFLDSLGTKQSCIDFAVENVFDVDDSVGEAAKNHSATRIKVGNRTGTRFVSRGVIDGVRIENVTVHVELPRRGRRVSVTLILVTPTEEKRTTEQVFEQCLGSFQFGP